MPKSVSSHVRGCVSWWCRSAFDGHSGEQLVVSLWSSVYFNYIIISAQISWLFHVSFWFLHASRCLWCHLLVWHSSHPSFRRWRSPLFVFATTALHSDSYLTTDRTVPLLYTFFFYSVVKYLLFYVTFCRPPDIRSLSVSAAYPILPNWDPYCLWQYPHRYLTALLILSFYRLLVVSIAEATLRCRRFCSSIYLNVCLNKINNTFI